MLFERELHQRNKDTKAQIDTIEQCTEKLGKGKVIVGDNEEQNINISINSHIKWN